MNTQSSGQKFVQYQLAFDKGFHLTESALRWLEVLKTGAGDFHKVAQQVTHIWCILTANKMVTVTTGTWLTGFVRALRRLSG